MMSVSSAGPASSGDAVGPAVTTGQLMRLCAHPCRECARPTHSLKMRDIIATVAAYFELPEEHLTRNRNRDRRAMDGRQFAAWLMCERFPGYPQDAIGKVLGYTDRTGVSHAIATLELRMVTHRELRDDLTTLRGLVAA